MYSPILREAEARGRAEERSSFASQVLKNMRTLEKSDLEISEVIGWNVKEIDKRAALKA